MELSFGLVSGRGLAPSGPVFPLKHIWNMEADDGIVNFVFRVREHFSAVYLFNLLAE